MIRSVRLIGVLVVLIVIASMSIVLKESFLEYSGYATAHNRTTLLKSETIPIPEYTGLGTKVVSLGGVRKILRIDGQACWTHSLEGGDFLVMVEGVARGTNVFKIQYPERGSLGGKGKGCVKMNIPIPRKSYADELHITMQAGKAIPSLNAIEWKIIVGRDNIHTLPIQREVTDISVSDKGTHSDTPSCPPNHTEIGRLIDCGRGICQGYQLVCAQYEQRIQKSPEKKTRIIDAFITAEGVHAKERSACPGGYSQFGSFEDCEGGECLGEQRGCFKKETSAHFMEDMYITPLGTHQQGGILCKKGYTNKGSIVDCGGEKCYGHQYFCVKVK